MSVQPQLFLPLRVQWSVGDFRGSQTRRPRCRHQGTLDLRAGAPAAQGGAWPRPPRGTLVGWPAPTCAHDHAGLCIRASAASTRAGGRARPGVQRFNLKPTWVGSKPSLRQKRCASSLALSDVNWTETHPAARHCSIAQRANAAPCSRPRRCEAIRTASICPRQPPRRDTAGISNSCRVPTTSAARSATTRRWYGVLAIALKASR